MIQALSADIASRFARIALGHVTREYPNKPDHVMRGDTDVYLPRRVHPIFFGSFDWHSCVHGYWLLARVRRLFPDLPEAPAIDALFASSLTPDKVASERDYALLPSSRGFERPYGWAWLLMLQAELLRAGSTHAPTLQPLADVFVDSTRRYLPLLHYPVRAGTHASTAFALVLMQRYARIAGDTALSGLLADRARFWFGSDRAAQAWEPGGEDFLSPTLIEALAMRRSLPGAEFSAWFAQFLPDLTSGNPATLFTPASVSDRSDGRIVHLDGLNLSRAWCMRAIASALPADGNTRILLDAAARHLDAALNEIAGDYMGEHWLASFALLALTDDGEDARPGGDGQGGSSDAIPRKPPYG